MTWSVATPRCVAPSSSIVSTEPSTPTVADTSRPERDSCGGLPKW